MRRRPGDPNVPTLLDTFNRADWPATTELDAFSLWRSARAAHEDRHGWQGGGIARMMVETDVGAVLTGTGLLPWNRSPAELEAIARRLGLAYGRRQPSIRHSRPR